MSIRMSARTSRLAAAGATVALSAAGLSTLVTGAFFTDTQSIGGNQFVTGTVDLAATPTTAAVSMSTMAPGDVTYGTVTVNNSGSLQMRYSLLSTSDTTDNNFLAAKLALTVKSGVTDCSAAGFAATGSVQLYTGVLGATTGTKVFGDAAQGAQTGDRTLAAGASETLCAKVELPTNADNTYAGKTTTTVLKFDAEQTANNA